MSFYARGSWVGLGLGNCEGISHWTLDLQFRRSKIFESDRNSQRRRLRSVMNSCDSNSDGLGKDCVTGTDPIIIHLFFV